VYNFKRKLFENKKKSISKEQHLEKIKFTPRKKPYKLKRLVLKNDFLLLLL
jgi:hypothetical protein